MIRYAPWDCALTGIVVSFNTREVLAECLRSFVQQCALLPGRPPAEILVVDNASTDGSAEMVEKEFAESPVSVRLIPSTVNLGFGGANNRAIPEARGKYLVLLNSDAFLHPGALGRALEHMESNPAAGIGGGCLVDGEGHRQPSARRFHSIWRDWLVMTGISARFPRSRILNPLDYSWGDPEHPVAVDWTPGAFWVLRREALESVGLFDPRFFLYYEETDLCRRIKAAGFEVLYWPDVVVTHLGGESSRELRPTGAVGISNSELWRMRSTLLYYRKHHGWQARLACWSEQSLYWMRRVRNRFSPSPARRSREQQAAMLSRLMSQAWDETAGGRKSPRAPW